MHGWIKITLILCLFGTLREFRPSEPFVTEFLLGKWRNITESQLNRDVYPVGTYSYLGLLVVVFLITDFLRFKPVIILSGISGIGVYAVLLWTTSLEWLQVSQVLYGIYMATEVAYFTYIYAKVDSSKYPKVSSYTRMAALTGRFLSGVSSQLLTHFNIMDLRDLNYLTLTAQILATFWAFWLPPVPYGIYFHRRSIASTTQSDIPIEKQPPQDGYDAKSFRSQISEATVLIYRHARSAYSRPKVVAWSALYAVALALFVQSQTYMQLLWNRIRGGDEEVELYNGAVEALQTAFGAAGAFLASYWTYAVLPAPIAAVQGVAMFLATYVNDITTSYTGYIVMGMLFHYTITLASAKIASQLSDESCFGLIFGINTLIGTGLQSILTLVLIQTLDLPIHAQYYFISGFFLLLASFWLLGCIIHFFKQKHSINLNQY
ncbi:thiamine transporter 2-like isoform X1 [Pieris brassicae]|uniref:thiamine transporter 2-like isoform X1 n=2 Tax=Pieris brassicae TaxID=7116 RepID=UPI001E66038F|nr:thiamine transporter 2-like isoform X1 [Pieris brassicae]XP_045524881.1 thiamine transporter 2-like isoform X1 [Pieris brassicae]XP_045524882.1 thiamine transporter 2-like isoform X1 [Pieris brassicae]